MKKSQFFLIAMVVILISMFYIYTYIRSADQSSTLFFDRPATLDLQNMIDSVQLRNERYLAQKIPWWNYGWTYRNVISFTDTYDNSGNPAEQAVSKTAEFDLKIIWAHHSNTDCSKELRLVDFSNAEVNSDVNSTTTPCSLLTAIAWTCPALTNCNRIFKYYVYYGNASATTPAYRSTAQGTELSSSGGLEEADPRLLCTHFKAIYPKTGATVDCSLVSYVGNKTNISIYYSSRSLKFNGSVI
ncbi:MAG TPA: hypothetical protein HA224_02125 [Nanoarchaeota archaeon]|nr:hypothetical protein [Nanoarchaeota archaeon]